MQHPSLAILGYSEAAMFLRKPGHGVTAILSIHGGREYGVEADVPTRLDLVFDDVEVPIPGDVLSMQRAMSRRRFATENGLVEVVPTIEDAHAIIAFAESLRGTSGFLLCHCGAGMSRAPAAALICLTVWRGRGSEAECAGIVRELRQGVVPHAGLVRFADQSLGREGRLVATIR
jgi:predicted protein tyrosine phosphatase